MIYETFLEAYYLMYNRKLKLSAWILSAAIAFSTTAVPVSAASVLPSVGVGTSLTVTESSLVTASNAQVTAPASSTSSADKSTGKKSDVFKGAGVEAAAGGIAAVSTTDKTEQAPVQDALTELSTDTAAKGSDVQSGAALVQTVATTQTQTAQTTDSQAAAETTTVEVPQEIADQPAEKSENDASQTAAGDSAATDGKVLSGADAAAASAREQYGNLVIAKCNDYVNVRKEPSEEAEILGKLYNESVGDFVSEAEGGWVEIISGTVRGYVKAEYVVTGDDAVERAKEVGKRIATVNTTTLYVREQATTDSPVVGMVPIEDDLSVLEEADEGWVKVSVEEGEGYVSSEFVTLKTEFTKAESKEEEEARLAKEKAEREAALAAASKKSGKKGSSSSGGGSGKSYAAAGSASGSAVANYALQFVGNPYVYGGSSLTNGTDCSGFVMSVYAAFGVGLPHSSGAQRGCGTDVGGLGNAQPGDIVCYSGHVGIYIGGGQIVHASTAKTGIKVSNAGYRDVLSVRRIF